MMRIRGRVALCVCASLLAAALGNAATAHWPERRLIVVIWERRAPRDAVAGAYGAVQKRNREEIVKLLYDDKSGLVGRDPSRTLIAIYPEGVDGSGAGTVDYDSLRSTPAERLHEYWLPYMLSMRDNEYEAPEPVHFTPAPPEKNALDDAIKKFITFPLLGLDFRYAKDETEGKPWDVATRGVSHPPLVTPYALRHAAETAKIPAAAFTNVYVIWAHGGERNYAITIPQLGLRRDYGEQAERYYGEAHLLYTLTPDESHTESGELAGGNVTVWRVERRIAVQNPVPPRIESGGNPAIFDERDWVLDLSMFPLPERRPSLSAVPWKIEYPDSRLIATDAVAIFERNGRVTRLLNAFAPVPIAKMIDEAIGPSTGRGWRFHDYVTVETLLEPKKTAPEYLEKIALRIPIVKRSSPAPVTVEITPLSQLVTYGLLLGFVYLLYRLLRRFRQRSLTVHVDWDTRDIDTFELRGPETNHEAIARVWLLDQSGYWPRWHDVDVTLTSQEEITTVPVRAESKRVTSFASGRKNVAELHERISAERQPVGSGTPVTLRIDAGAVDFAQVEPGRDLRGAYSFSITAIDRSKRYRPASRHESKQYRIAVKAFRPEYKIEAQPLDEIKRRGLVYDPKLTESVPERRVQIGRILVDNPPVAAGAALQITVTAGEARARIHADSKSYPAHAFAVTAQSGEDTSVAIPNSGHAEWNVYVVVTSATDWTKRRAWEIDVEMKLSVLVVGDSEAITERHSIHCDWYPVNRNPFTCLDLGTSTTRLLIQGVDPERYGYLEFPQTVRGSADPEDLPSMCYFDDNDVRLGSEALFRLTQANSKPARFRRSVKASLLRDGVNASKEFERYADAVLERFYRKTVHKNDPDHPAVDVIAVNRSGDAPSRKTIARGPRQLLVMTVPNEAPPAMLDAYRKALGKEDLFQRVLLLREGEAVALDYIERRHQLGGEQMPMRILALDIGAGTSDAALVKADVPPGGGEITATVIASAGAFAAGDRVDRAILDALGAREDIRMKRNFAELNPQQQFAYLRACEGVKRASAAGDRRHVLNFDGDEQQIDLVAIRESPEYRNALREIVDVPIRMLLGRIPPDEARHRVQYLLLTGRGSLIHGAMEHFRESTRAIAVEAEKVKIENAGGNASLLKSAVSLGARSFAQWHRGPLQLTDDRFNDRVVVLGVRADGVEPRIAIESGRLYDRETHTIEEEVTLDPSWLRVVVIRTFLRLDGALGDDLQLDEERRRRAVARRLESDTHEFVAELPRPAAIHTRKWIAAVHVSPRGKVSVTEVLR